MPTFTLLVHLKGHLKEKKKLSLHLFVTNTGLLVDTMYLFLNLNLKAKLTMLTKCIA